MFAPEIELPDDIFKTLVGHLESWSGIKLSLAKRQMMEIRLRKRLTALDCPDFACYLKLLTELGSNEKIHFVDAMTTNETYFFREPYHFDYLQTLFKTEFTSKNRLNIWSAAASYGEEAYSVSMLTQDIYPLGGWKIHATDISNTALEKAKEAEFDEYDFRMLPEKYMKKHVSASGKNAMFKLDNKTKQSVSFQQLNLLESFNLNSQFDIIMLRNVLIYFEMSNKIKVVKNVIKHLKPGGYFFISISESPLSRDICKATGLENLGKGIFKKGNG